MATLSHSTTGSSAFGPAWASSLGVIVIVLGVFLTAMHGTEWMKQYVMVNNMPAKEMPAADCPEEELEEEGISLAECEYMVEHVWGLGLSTPDWFPGVQMGLSLIGTLLAFLSIIIGGALVNYKSWALPAAVAVFGGLIAIDALQFMAVVNAGPIIRGMYLWSILLWLIIHLLMMTGVFAGRHAESGD
ncbi:MAG: hypothetical protein U5P41_13200 [Gammaproteobacteria bacterium]|nr:hypothetical protein [Gammaproteobacteria bacterium]